MKIKVILLTIITLAFFTACGENPFYPLKEDPRYDFYGRWQKEVGEGAGTVQSYVIITKNKLFEAEEIYTGAGMYSNIEYKIIDWEPYSNPNNNSFFDYPSGYRLKVTVIKGFSGVSAPENVYIYMHNDGNSLRLGWNNAGNTMLYYKQ